MRRLEFAFVLSSLIGVLGTPGLARPSVALHLSGELASLDAKGKKTLAPITSDTILKSGDVVHYDIVAKNAGNEPAVKLAPVGRVPAGMTYEVGTASSTPVATVEFSIDGGKTWAKTPIVAIKTQSGVIERRADPATYTTIRWLTNKPVAPGSSVSYTYEVRVK